MLITSKKYPRKLRTELENTITKIKDNNTVLKKIDWITWSTLKNVYCVHDFVKKVLFVQPVTKLVWYLIKR